MTRVAIVSDVHGDVHALADALRHIDAMDCELIVSPGDMVDYGLFPDEAIALLRERDVLAVRGNHDRWALVRGDASDLSPASRRWLAGLPTRASFERSGVRVEIVHGSPRGDMDGIELDGLDAAMAYRHIEKAEADVLVVGHTHVALEVRLRGDRRIVNPGALLREPAHPGLGPPATGTFAVLELPSRDFRVHRAADGVALTIPRLTLW